jgi:glycosyltransferase involved in cell wall biosynthesis
MKLMVISHSVVTSVNQQLYSKVERQTGWTIMLVCPSNWRDDFGREKETERWPEFGGELISLPVWRPGSIVFHAYRPSLIRLLRRVRPDVIYVNHEPYAVATAQAYMANAMVGRRPIGYYSAQNIRKKYPPPFCWAEQFVYRHSNFSFPVTKEVEGVMRAKGYRGQATVLPLSFDPKVYRTHPDRDRLRAELRQAPDEILLGYVGRIVKSKGLDTLCRALALLKDLSWRLVVVGSGSFEEEFDALVLQLGLRERVTRIGFVPHVDVPRFYSALDVVVVPSESQRNWKEQFGRVITEAMACGTPVVGSDSGEIPNLIGQTGGGLVFPERQPNALAAQLRKMIQSDSARNLYGKTGQREVLERFSNDSLAPRFVETIERAMGKVVSTT